MVPGPSEELKPAQLRLVFEVESLQSSPSPAGTPGLPAAVHTASGIPGSIDLAMEQGELHYAEDTHVESVTNNGHTIQYNLGIGENYAIFEGARFDLLQIHFHSPSEHTINGVRYRSRCTSFTCRTRANT